MQTEIAGPFRLTPEEKSFFRHYGGLWENETHYLEIYCDGMFLSLLDEPSAARCNYVYGALVGFGGDEPQELDRFARSVSWVEKVARETILLNRMERIFSGFDADAIRRFVEARRERRGTPDRRLASIIRRKTRERNEPNLRN